MPSDAIKISIFLKKAIEKNTPSYLHVLIFCGMGKPTIKLVTDFGPLLIFFLIYFNSGQNLKIAIPPVIVATIIALLIIYFLEKKIPMLPLVSCALVTLFGGLTLYFDNKIFFYMKPTIINILFAGILLFGKYFTRKPLLKIIFQNTINLEDEGWKKLNYRWISFFLFVALLNEIVWRTQSEAFWVNFKVWGLLPISFLFAASQIPLMNKYKLKK